MKKILVAILVVFMCNPISRADELSRIQTEIKQTEQKNKKLEEQVQLSERDVAATKKKLVKAADQVSSLEEQRGEMSKKISELDAEIKKLSDELNVNKTNLADAATGITFIASHPSFDTDDMHDYVLMSAVVYGLAENLDAEIQTVSSKVEKLTKLRDARANEKEKLDRTAEKYASQKKELDKLLKTRSAQNQKLKTEQMALQKKLRDLSARAKNISELSAGVGSSEMSSDARFSRRKLNLPVRGRVVVHFGEKTALGLKSDGWRIHTRGDALVSAPADGVVKFADYFKGFGRVIIMSHKNGYNTVMTNLGDIDVLVEQEVLAGEPVGRMNPDKSEMYLEVRRGNKVVDPSFLFKDE